MTSNCQTDPSTRIDARFEARVLCRDPLIVLGKTPLPGSHVGTPTLLSPMIGDRPAWFLIRLHWQFETPSKRTILADEYRRQVSAHPRHRIVFLANSVHEAWRLQQSGLPAVLCNHNAFVDETKYVVLPSEERQFDAVYNARLHRYKRHELAIAVRSLALIYDSGLPTDRVKRDAVHAILPHAFFVNHAEAEATRPGIENPRTRMAAALIAAAGRVPWIAPERVALWLNRARVGLCLSRSEGAMLASMEYLLCGLPIVSTRSMGGRDHYFEPAHSRIVGDDPAEVADAVATLAAARIDPLEVRTTALAKIRYDRACFVRFVQALIEDGGGDLDFAAAFTAIQAEGLLPRRSHAQIVADLAG